MVPSTHTDPHQVLSMAILNAGHCCIAPVSVAASLPQYSCFTECF